MLRSGGSLRGAGMDMIGEEEADLLGDERCISYIGVSRSARWYSKWGGSYLRIRGGSVVCRRDGSVRARMVDLLRSKGRVCCGEGRIC